MMEGQIEQAGKNSSSESGAEVASQGISSQAADPARDIALLLRASEAQTKQNADMLVDLARAKNDIKSTQSLAVLGFVVMLLTVMLGLASIVAEYLISVSEVNYRLGALEAENRYLRTQQVSSTISSESSSISSTGTGHSLN